MSRNVPDFVVMGAPVWYESSPGRKFAATVASEPWVLGGHTLCVRLEGLGDDYAAITCAGRHHVPCAAVDALTPRAALALEAKHERGTP